MEYLTPEQLKQLSKEKIAERIIATQKETECLERQQYILKQLVNGKQPRLHKQIPEV